MMKCMLHCIPSTAALFSFAIENGERGPLKVAWAFGVWNGIMDVWLFRPACPPAPIVFLNYTETHEKKSNIHI